MILLRRVQGHSMLPYLRPGQLVIAFSPINLKPSDVVIFRHNNLEKIKRISKIKDNQLYLLGDNLSMSTDSRTFGWIKIDEVIAKVIFLRKNK